MQVYIEYVILDNFIMDYILIKETARILRVKCKKTRAFFSAFTGTVGAVVFPLIKIKSQYMFLLKILLGALICFIAREHGKISRFIKFYNVFLLLTFSIGGGVIGVMYLIGIDLKSYGNGLSGVLPIGITVLIGYITAIILKRAITNTMGDIMTTRFRYDCIIKSGAYAVKVRGYYDSGNLLFDSKTGLPVVLCKKRIIEKIKKGNPNFFSKRDMEFSTVKGSGRLNLYEVDCILIDVNGTNKKTACVLAEVASEGLREDLLLGAYTL